MSTVPDVMAGWAPPTDKPDAIYEFVDGEWKETPRMGAFASLMASLLAQRLNTFAKDGKLGLAMGEVLFRLTPEGPARRPDVAFVSSNNWTCIGPFADDPPALDVVPDLAVEVNSPSNSADEIVQKAHEYFFAGTRLVWVIYPRMRKVHVHESPEHIRVLSGNDILDGGLVLPGFRLPLNELFTFPVYPKDSP